MITIVRSEKSWIESNAVDQLKKVAELEGIIKAVGLPDLHIGKTPVGASYMTKDVIYPHIVGNDIGCGMALFTTGIKKKKFKIDKNMKKLNNIDTIEDIDISDLIQHLNLPFKEKLGTIGSGNHFAEFQGIDTIYNENSLEEIGIDKDNIFLLVHSGSRSYGEHILREYIEKHQCQKGLKINSEALQDYMMEHNRALEFARLNRELIANRILQVVDAKENIKLLDSVHNGISEKEIDGENYYIHRKGASPSDIGYVVIAGSRGSKSYIVEPEENLVEYAFSVSHGAGRKWNRMGCKEKLENMYSKKSVRQGHGIANLVYKDKNVVYEEAPEAYKNIERVIEDMLDAKMIKLVASLNPLITYKV